MNTAAKVFNYLYGKATNTVFTYISESALRPDTVTAGAFSLRNSANGSYASIESVVYEAATRTLTVYADAASLAEPYSYVLSSDATVLNADSSVASVNETLYAGYGMYADEGTASVISVNFSKDGIPVYNLTGISDFTVNILASNTRKPFNSSITYTVYANSDKTIILGNGTAVFDDNGFSTFSVTASGYTMKQTDEITVEFDK